MTGVAWPLATLDTIPRAHWDGQLALDLFAPCAEPWRAPVDGMAEPAEYPNGGAVVWLEGDDGRTYYAAHLAYEGRRSGRVAAGDVLGYIGQTGNAAGKGCHVHLGIASSRAVIAALDGAGDVPPWDVLEELRARTSGGSPTLAASAGPVNAEQPRPWLAWLAAGIAAAWALDLL